MGRWAKVGVVIAGYVAAGTAAVAAAWLYNVRVSRLPYDTSGGMYAAGEMLCALGAFLIVALVPTVLLLQFLRHRQGFWNGVAILSLAFALIGLVAVLAPLVTHGRVDHVGLMILGLVGLAQLLGVPIWAIAFAVFALLAPTRVARHRLVAALGIEVVIGACALVHWFTPAPPL